MSPCTPTVLQCTTRFAPPAFAASMIVPNSRRVDRSILLFSKTGLPVDRRDVINDVDAVGRAPDGGSDRVRSPRHDLAI